jgi:hypothetical protein
VPVDNSFELLAATVRAALRQPRHKTAGVPGGDIGVERLAAMSVSHGRETRPVALYAFTGVSPQPAFRVAD